MYRYRSLVLVMVVGACGGDASDAGGATCEAVTACVVDAVAALRACVPNSALALGTPTNNSGTVSNLTCTADTQTIAFSTFSFNVTGTVPVPSTVTISEADASCAVVNFGTGSRTNQDGSSVEYLSSTIGRPGAEAVTVNRYSNGELGVKCGNLEEVIASSEKLTECAQELEWPTLERNADITSMKMRLEDAGNGTDDLFNCVR